MGVTGSPLLPEGTGVGPLLRPPLDADVAGALCRRYASGPVAGAWMALLLVNCCRWGLLSLGAAACWGPMGLLGTSIAALSRRLGSAAASGKL